MEEEKFARSIRDGERQQVSVAHSFDGKFLAYEDAPEGRYAVFATLGPIDNPKPGNGTRRIRVSEIVGLY